MLDFVLEKVQISKRLKELNVSIATYFLACCVLTLLLVQFDWLKVTYNAQNDNWNINDLISIFIQEEWGINRSKTNRVHVALKPKPTRSSKRKSKCQKSFD